MKEILEKWAKFVKEQAEAREKVASRMKLWCEENPLTFPEYNRYLPTFDTYGLYRIMKSSEEGQLNKKFGVVDITLENLLTSLLPKE